MGPAERASGVPVIAIAERLDITEVATLDRRHFPNVPLRHAEYPKLLP